MEHALIAPTHSKRLPITGGTRHAREAVDNRIATDPSFTDDQHREFYEQTMWGESLDHAKLCWYLHDRMEGLRINRGEHIINGVSYVEPNFGVDEHGILVADQMEAEVMFNTPIAGFGTTLLQYRDWLCIGMPARIEERTFPRGSDRPDELLLAVIPDHVALQDVIDGRVYVLPNPLHYVMTPDELSQFNKATSGSLEQVAKALELEI